jgi:flavocytochrome c
MLLKARSKSLFNCAPAVALLLTALVSCTYSPGGQDADVIIVGAGIAGLSAALEASSTGARVLVIEKNSVGGGHAVKAGGFALVDTALQREKGIADSPERAFRDLSRWGEDPDPYWTRYYVEQSGPDVYDWLTAMGVEFRVIIDTPESSVPRFHFTRGTSVNVIIPMMRKALLDPNIDFLWNTRVTELARSRGQITGVFTANERDGSKRQLRAANTLLATGGFQNNLQLVRDNWPEDKGKPEQLYKGAGKFATGDGYRLASWAGADLQNMNRQVTFYSGVPDPHDPSGTKGLYAENPAGIWLASNGRRFINESANSKEIAKAVTQLKPMSYWIVFDAKGSRRFNVRDALTPNKLTVRDEILANPELTVTADTLDELAQQSGLPVHGLRTSIETWNRMVEVGTDFQYDRFKPGKKATYIRKINEPPYYALHVYPLTRKSMGGPAINTHAQVVDKSGLPIPGLYAAGELTGVAGINGQHGGSGTFLGPSVITGRVAGRSAGQASLAAEEEATRYRKLKKKTVALTDEPPNFDLPGYWHYDAVHRLAFEQAYTCDRCHSDSSPIRMANKAAEMQARLNTCTTCH